MHPSPNTPRPPKEGILRTGSPGTRPPSLWLHLLGGRGGRLGTPSPPPSFGAGGAPGRGGRARSWWKLGVGTRSALVVWSRYRIGSTHTLREPSVLPVGLGAWPSNAPTSPFRTAARASWPHAVHSGRSGVFVILEESAAHPTPSLSTSDRSLARWGGPGTEGWTGLRGCCCEYNSGVGGPHGLLFFLGCVSISVRSVRAVCSRAGRPAGTGAGAGPPCVRVFCHF